MALADEAQRAIGAASRDREGPRGNASGMGGSEGKGAGGAQKGAGTPEAESVG